MTNGQGLTDSHQTSLLLQCFNCYITLFISLKKDADGNCKLAVETLQDSNLSSKSVFITRSHCFHFVLLVHQCRESLIY